MAAAPVAERHITPHARPRAPGLQRLPHRGTLAAVVCRTYSSPSLGTPPGFLLDSQAKIMLQERLSQYHRLMDFLQRQEYYNAIQQICICLLSERSIGYNRSHIG